MEYDVNSDVDTHKLETSISPIKNHEHTIVGRRILDLAYICQQIKEKDNHDPYGCSFKDMVCVNEKKIGLKSSFAFKCNFCLKTYTIDSESSEANMTDINIAAVAGIMNVGGGFSQLQTMTASLEIPPLSQFVYNKSHDIVCKSFNECALKEMEAAAKEEAQLAVSAGDIDTDGTPLISVVADGSWCKRSYRSTYNSLSGAAAIIGYRTKKVLFLGVKNKYCSICIRSGLGSKEVKEHCCTKNWSDKNGSSGMEAAVIVEGFKQSEPMYGIRYQKLIADGDSSVYKKILEARPYKNLTVQKVECRNHLLRNFCNKLRDITTKKQAGQLAHRKLLSRNILRMRKGIVKAIEYRKKENSVIGLRNDILNVVNHVFGDHSSCSKYFCDITDDNNSNDINYMEKIFSTDRVFIDSVMQPIRYLARHTSSLILNVDSNIVESFNAIIAKLIGGKRVNFALKGSYAGRCAIATVTKNSKRPFYSLHKTILKNSPFKKLPSVKMEITRRDNQFRQNNRLTKNKRFKKKLFGVNDSNASYGENSMKPDMNENEYNIEKLEVIESMKKINV
ncbi:uncharacterized protein LOC132949126 [Metopolophium dirhodum]|uniref:uncharacterized protein LOC132949126 n=1 Tax=Metopolophium dirhodum TaxID=44670 RepID=UPI002990167F|nr:uncharacterized protein LOC132949126 [Metopolophium dirhodum]